MNGYAPHRPTPESLGLYFKEQTKCDPPPDHKTYECQTASPVVAVPEWDAMGGVVISYPGTVSRSAMPSQSGPTDQLNLHAQLPPGGPRAFGIPDELIIHMQQADTTEPVHVFIFCCDPGEKARIVTNLTAAASAMGLKFDPNLIHLVAWDTDTYWSRDYSPWWIHNSKTGCYGIAKHTYTTLGGGSVGLVEGAEGVSPLEGLGIFRPNDDYAAVKLSDYLNAPIRQRNRARWSDGEKTPVQLHQINEHDWFFSGLLNVGGNFMVTKDGTIASSYLVATQNELPVDDKKWTTEPCPAVIEQRMRYILEQLNKFMGIKKYHVITDPSGTYIGHIDCWGKFLGDKKVLIANSQDPKIARAYQGIADWFHGECGFEVHRVMCQRIYVPNTDPTTAATTAAYTNSLILNKRVYVPITGDKQYDDLALDEYRGALPGYEVIGILGKSEYPWLGTDAMHCRTNAIPREVVNNWLESQRQADFAS